MARRDSLFRDLLLVPWWVAAGLAVVTWFVPPLVQAKLFAGNSAFEAPTRALLSFRIVFVGIFLVLALGSYLRRRFAAGTLDAQRDLASLRELPWKDFEDMVAEAYRRQGYGVEENLGAGPDGGVDLTLRRGSETLLVQCKRWRKSRVDVRVVREMFGLLNADPQATGVVIVTTSDFTRDAAAFAVGKPITLIDGPALLELVREVQRGATAADVPAEVPAPAATNTIAPPTAARLAASANAAEEEPNPACPKCGGVMKRRTARKGANVGNDFWGCANYPRCSGTREV